MSFLLEIIIDIFGGLFGSWFSRGKSEAPQTADEIVSRLERLVALRDAGHITEEKFVEQRDKILGSDN